jgi:2-amino-4-hydroxy-6-hydroxymethyldihydropteridine diphosphokinase
LTTVLVALGSNLGDRRGHLEQALGRLAATSGVRSVRAGDAFETDPVGGPPQGPFLNACVLLETDLDPRQMLAALRAVEAGASRVRQERWGPRTLDLDLLLHGDTLLEEPDLTVPHPRMLERAFVLIPAAELAPDLVHPGLGRTLGDLAGECGGDGLRRLGPLEARP